MMKIKTTSKVVAAIVGFGLALSMFVSLVAHVPEVITGTIGIVFVAAAYWSSVRFQSVE